MNKHDYWQRRYLQIKASELKNIAAYEIALKTRLSDIENELEKEVTRWLQLYSANSNIDLVQAQQLLQNVNTKNWHLSLAEFKRKAIAGGYDKELNEEYFKMQTSRLQDIEAQIQKIMGQFAKDEKPRLQSEMINQFKDTYVKNIYNTQLQAGKLTSNFAHFDENAIKIILSKPWKGNNFSQRIWQSYTNELPNQLVDVLLKGTILGYSPNKITKMLRQRFNDVRDHQIHRLVITEMGHVAEQATAKAYEQAQIDKYEYLATLESHTCEQCAHLDGRIFDFKKKRDGINYPLIHPYCRCTTMPYMEDLPAISERWMLDSETGKGRYIENMTFDEWIKHYSSNKYLN